MFHVAGLIGLRTILAVLIAAIPPGGIGIVAAVATARAISTRITRQSMRDSYCRFGLTSSALPLRISHA